MHVASVTTVPLHDIRRPALRSVRTFVPPVVAVFSVGMLVAETMGGRGEPFVALEAIVGVIGGAFLFARRNAATGSSRDAVLDTLWVGLVSLFTLLHFGPTAGVAAGWLGIGLLGRYFMGGRAALLIAGAVLVAHLGAAAALHLNVIPAPAPATHDFAQPGVWVRIGMVVVGVLLTVNLVFSQLIDAFQRALVREAEARREREHALEARHEAEAERARALLAAEAAQNADTVGRLAGGVAHDVNNALTVIQGNLELLEEGCDPEERAALLEEMRLAATGAARTSSELLALARGALDASGRASARGVLSSLQASLRRLLPVDLQVSTRTMGEVDAEVDVGALRRAVLNLLFNARDAVGSGGHIEFLVYGEEGPRGPELAVEIRDDGVGMDAATLKRARDPFFTTKGPAYGTGLGLTIVHDFVEREGGALEIESRLGVGTVVRLRLPAGVPAGAEGAAPRGADPSDLRGIRVLCADDEPPLRRILRRHLERAGAVVTLCADAAGLRARIAQGDPYDLLVTDAVMPGGGTPEAIRAFRDTYPMAPVVVVSGHVQEELVRRGIETGDIDFLPKPFTGDELLRLLVEVLGTRHPGLKPR